MGNDVNFLIRGPVYDEPVNLVQNVTGTAVTVVRILVVGLMLIYLVYIAIGYFSKSPKIIGEQKRQAPLYLYGIFIILGISAFMPFLAKIVDDIVQDLV